jgi:predicted nucleotidyltransferase
MHAAIANHKAEIFALRRRFNVRRLEIFGSAARGDDFDILESDADFLVEF